MALYKVTVATGNFLMGGTMDSISITLVGTQGESTKQPLNKSAWGFTAGAVDECSVTAEQDLGRILLIRLHKEQYSIFPEDSWYCDYVAIERPGEEPYRFPCYQWIEGYKTMELREGTAKLIFEDTDPILLEHRRVELEAMQASYRWKAYPGCPWGLDVNTIEELGSDFKFSVSKKAGIGIQKQSAVLELKLKGLLNLTESWKSFEDIHRVFWKNRTDVSEYVFQHWKEDAFFGYQFLNGVNPEQIQKCAKIPPNFPVTEEMVESSLGSRTSLQQELQKGNLFIVDYKVLEEIPANVIKGRPQYRASPMCLLYWNPADDLVPIAIQLGQTPGPDSPIFLPSDSELDWTLAKMWVRNADFLVNEALSHYLTTHLLIEVFLVSTLRLLPSCHPVYKLLFPHFRYTMNSNMVPRTNFLAPGGVYDQSSSIGSEHFPLLLKKGLELVTYNSLCAPESFRSRGMEAVPKYYFRDDSLKLWTATKSFVSSIVECYYHGDDFVQKDSELQAWVGEIFSKGFLQREASGVPSALKTRPELTKYLTMIIYACSIKHAAVHSPQFDFYYWMPNAPASMRNPPPETKGTATQESILETLPEVDSTCRMMILMWVVTRTYSDMVHLGSYPNQLFTDKQALQSISAFQKRLGEISAEIQKRNESLQVKYSYLDPTAIENSITI